MSIKVERRLKASFVASIYGQLVTTLIALASVPFFLHFWSLEDYGRWLIIYSVPAYVIAADLGVGSVTLNKMVLSSSKGQQEINVVFNTSLVVITLLAFLVIILSAASSFFAVEFFNYEIRQVAPFFLMALLAAVSLYNPCMDAAMRVHGKYAESIFLMNTFRLVEWSVGLVMLFINPTFIAVASGMLLSRLFMNMAFIIICGRLKCAAKWSFKSFCSSEMRSILKPAIAFSLFPLSNVALLQGTLLMVSSLLGSSAVAIFSCYRTLTRSSTQLIAVINKSYWSEFTDSYGKKDGNRLSQLLGQCKGLNVMAGAAVAVLLILFGGDIISAWTSGQVVMIYEVYFLMVVGVALTGFWQANWVFLMALNLHQRISIKFFWVSLLTVACAFFAIKEFGLVGAAAAPLLFEVLMIFIARNETRQVLGV